MKQNPSAVEFTSRTLSADDPLLARYGLPKEDREVVDIWIETRLPGPLYDDWRMATRYVRNEAGQAVVDELRIFPHDKTHSTRGQGDGEWAGAVLGIDAGAYVPRAGIPGALPQKAIRIEAHRKFAVEACAAMSRYATLIEQKAPRARMVSAFATFAPKPRIKQRNKQTKIGRPVKWTEGFLADAALAYDDGILNRLGDSAIHSEASGVRYVATRKGCSYGTARAIIAKARTEEFSLIPPCGRGEHAIPMSPEWRARVKQVAQDHARKPNKSSR